MSRRIFKYILSINDITVVWIPKGGEILTVSSQHNQIALWVLVDTEQIIEECRFFHAFKTGEVVVEHTSLKTYLGTCKFDNDSYVIHVFETHNPLNQ